MRADSYTKIVLTVIAVFLAALAMKIFVPPEHPQQPQNIANSPALGESKSPPPEKRTASSNDPLGLGKVDTRILTDPSLQRKEVKDGFDNLFNGLPTAPPHEDDHEERLEKETERIQRSMGMSEEDIANKRHERALQACGGDETKTDCIKQFERR